MDNNSNELIDMFHKIACKGWIPNCGINNQGNIGITFEHEIGKDPDSKYLPDYKDIEIKCTSRYSKYPLHLFTLAFDGPGENEINRLAEKFGYYDSDYPSKKILYRRITNSINQVNKYNFFLVPDYLKHRLYLAVYNGSGELIEKESYIEFDTIKERLNTKLSKMALVYASKKTIDNQLFFRYYKLLLFSLKDFDSFIELIRLNKLEISIVARISKSGSDKGRYRNKNIDFAIPKENIESLFDCYYNYDYDKLSYAF